MRKFLVGLTAVIGIAVAAPSPASAYLHVANAYDQCKADMRGSASSTLNASLARSAGLSSNYNYARWNDTRVNVEVYFDTNPWGGRVHVVCAYSGHDWAMNPLAYYMGTPFWMPGQPS